MSKKKGKIVVSGIMFWFPLAGVTYQFLHYLLGLRRLGYDPYYIEDSARWMYDPRTKHLSPDPTFNIQKVAPALAKYGFKDRWAYRGRLPGSGCHGMTENKVIQLYNEADAFLNITGSQEIHEEHLRIPRRIYIETDPVASQIKVSQGDTDMIAMLNAHDTHFTFGENIGAPDCSIPSAGYDWRHTRQPVIMDLWDTSSTPVSDQRAYTTVTTWDNKGKDILFKGETFYWSKQKEFLKFIDLPRQTSAVFELATRVDKEEDRLLLHNYGWNMTLVETISDNLETYRNYIVNSRAEFTVAKDQNIRLNSGWFSDRSACYLAAGRPVITQETGFSKILPTGKGLFSFRTKEDCLFAIDAIESNYSLHSKAALDIACEYFSAEKVVGRLLQEAKL